MLALMPCERSAVLPEGVASGVLNGADVGGILDRGGVGGGVMALTRSWETDRDLIGGGGGIRAVWRLEMGDGSRSQSHRSARPVKKRSINQQTTNGHNRLG